MVLAAALLPVGAAAAPPAAFDPIAFFTGRTEGVGRIKVVLRAASPIRVQGQGRVEPDGTLVLDQLVSEGGKAPRRREWRLRATAPGRYAGTLTDAAGPVTGEVNGARLTLSFRTTSGFAVQQLIDLAADGRSARNMLRVRRFGLQIAVLDETIRKLD